MTPDELKRYFPQASADTILKNCGVEKDAERERNPGDESVAAPARARPDPVRRLVRLTSYRCRLLDERNSFDKYFVDALVYAGILFDDSPVWAQIEVSQRLVHGKELERTEIEVFDL